MNLAALFDAADSIFSRYGYACTALIQFSVGVEIICKVKDNKRKEEQTMKKQIAFAVILTYLWMMMILLGSIILETFMIYPNIFRSVPESFETAREFMSVTGPAQFFRPFGFLTWAGAIGALVVGWHLKSARYWILGSLIMIGCEGLASIIFFWPRNTILFVEGTAMHSADFLRQIAQEFQLWHWSRLAFNLAAAVLIFIGFLKFYCSGIMPQVASHETQVSASTE